VSMSYPSNDGSILRVPCFQEKEKDRSETSPFLLWLMNDFPLWIVVAISGRDVAKTFALRATAIIQGIVRCLILGAAEGRVGIHC
jgi:hypothetical protein